MGVGDPTTGSDQSQSYQSESLVLSFNYWERETLLAEVAKLQRHKPGEAWGRRDLAWQWRERKGQPSWETVQPVVNKFSLCHRVAGSKDREQLRKQKSWVHQGLHLRNSSAVNLYLCELLLSIFRISLISHCHQATDLSGLAPSNFSCFIVFIPKKASRDSWSIWAISCYH